MTIEITARTHTIAQRMFLETADLNYVGARAAYFEERYWDFWWLTLHAVEKYLKAMLLMNGASAKGAGHDLPRLFRQVRALDARLAPPSLDIAGLEGGCTGMQFYERLNDYGAADNRYGLYGYTVYETDLQRADTLVYWARRFARAHNATYGDQAVDWIAELTLAPREWIQHAGPLETLARLPAGDRRRHNLTFLNAAFFPELPHDHSSWRSVSHDAPLAEIWKDLERAERGSSAHLTSHAVVTWALENIHFNGKDRGELEKLLADHPID